MPALDSRIDELYQQPLDQFTASRNALAKSLAGDEAKRVRALQKPTVVPWAINQLYWRSRPLFDRLRKTGEQLRSAQIAALKGRAADVRAASAAQRDAIAAASARAQELAAEAGSHPSGDELTRTLEALALAAELPEPPGRLTKALQPAGFEALAGVQPAALKKAKPVPASHPRPAATHTDDVEKRRLEAEIAGAEAALDRAKAAADQAHANWERAKLQVDAAERRLKELKAGRRARGSRG